MKASPLVRGSLAALCLFGQTAQADADRRSDTREFSALMHCYARCTDAIGDATTNSNPRAAGLAIHEKCFTQDTAFRAWFPQQPFDSQTFPNPASATPVVGPANWATFVDSVFGHEGDDFTQRMIGNVDVSISGWLHAFLNATHVISGTEVGGESRCMQVPNGASSLIGRTTGNQWRTVNFDPTPITFDRMFGCGA